MSIGVCIVVRNEATYLPEWIAYYRAIGFNKIIVYDNDSTDLTSELLRNLAQLGYVDHRPWPDRPRTNRQVSAYEDAIKRGRDTLDWIAFFDIDEFLVLHRDENIRALMRDYEAFDGLAVNWKIFGSAGIAKREPGLVIERFVRCASRATPVNRCIKVIVKPANIKRCNIHVCYPTVTTIVDENKTDVMKTLIRDGIHLSVCHDRTQLNHYSVRSHEEWQQKKQRGRGAVTPENPDQHHDDSRLPDLDQNGESDKTALRYAEPARDILKSMGDDLIRSGFEAEWKYLSSFF